MQCNSEKSSAETSNDMVSAKALGAKDPEGLGWQAPVGREQHSLQFLTGNTGEQ